MRTYSAEEAPQSVLSLTHTLMPQLLAGDHPTLATLRTQYAAARIEEIEWSGVGFFVCFDVPADAPRTQPADLVGGDALISIRGVPDGATCVLFVSDGRLRTLELVTWDGPWAEDAEVLRVESITPLDPAQ